MTKTDLAAFRELLRAKQIELSGKPLSLEASRSNAVPMNWRRPSTSPSEKWRSRV
jgi:hypothetical protein